MSLNKEKNILFWITMKDFSFDLSDNCTIDCGIEKICVKPHSYLGPSGCVNREYYIQDMYSRPSRLYARQPNGVDMFYYYCVTLLAVIILSGLFVIYRKKSKLYNQKYIFRVIFYRINSMDR